ncbi:MAG: ATP-dependent RNA helicase [Spirochaetales bacterium]|nr:ATP-dependent RNA helicase [Spirochaetales bacterium]
MDIKKLPVYEQKQQILDALKSNQVIVVESPTGSGKTTQIPVILKEAGYAKKGMIGVTQPRRIAALSVSEFIAKQLNTDYPGEVGYKMRFEDVTSEQTKIKIMTDGILLQELKYDRILSQYSVIMIDEAHERSLNIDFILGLIKQIIKYRKDLKVIISSATIQPKIFSEYFHNCPIVTIKTPVYPVDIVYRDIQDNPRPEEIIDKTVECVEDYISEENEGDILVFLSGEKLIKDCILKLMNSKFSSVIYPLPLYGRLSKEEQEKVFDPAPNGKRKVIVSTNIAETSVTIQGVKAVIDSGLAKINYYNNSTLTSSLIETEIAKASCNQRKGRAGRTSSGTCYRLYSEEGYLRRQEFTLDEIYRTDLSEVVLRMSELEIRDFENFDFISKPKIGGISSAVKTLIDLGAITQERDLTNTGRMMVEFPLLPRHSRIIVEAIKRYPDVLKEILIAVSFLSTHSPFLLPQGEELEARHAHHSFRTQYGDFPSYLNIYEAYHKASNKEKFCKASYLDIKIMHEISNIVVQLEEIVSEKGIPITGGGTIENFIKAIATGLMHFVCVKTNKFSYRSMTADKIMIHPGSVLFKENPMFIVAGEIVKTSKTFARSVSLIKKEWIQDISKSLYITLQGNVKYQKTKKKERDDEIKDNEIRIAGIPFPINQEKGNKIVVMQWSNVKRAISSSDKLEIFRYKKHRGKLLFSTYTIMEGEKIPAIIFAAAHIKPESQIVKYAPKKNFNTKSKLDNIDTLDEVLKLTQLKKKSRSLGFIALKTNGQGSYWYSVENSYFVALDTSLNSFEYLIDEIYEISNKVNKKKINSIYSALIKIDRDRLERIYN